VAAVGVLQAWADDPAGDLPTFDNLGHPLPAERIGTDGRVLPFDGHSYYLKDPAESDETRALFEAPRTSASGEYGTGPSQERLLRRGSVHPPPCPPMRNSPVTLGAQLQ
jgi:hypothetical protein